MRFVLVALALAACRPAAGPATPPANKAPAPDHRATADDELGFLPADSDIVLGLDAAEFRRSQLWHVFEPQLIAFSNQLQQQFGGQCANDMIYKTGRMAMAVKAIDRKRFSAVIVFRGSDMPRILECSVAELKRRGTVTVDRDVTISTSPQTPDYSSAMTLVGQSTLVMQTNVGANYDTLSAVLRSGAPLRASPAFMKLYDRRERGSSIWGMANGSSSMFDQLAASGMRPKSIDGTIVVTNRLVLAVRMTMGTPAEADALAAEINKVKPMAGAYVTRLDVGVQGPIAEIQVELDEAQVRSLAGMFAGVLAGAVGP